jgi:DNA-binding beta-propeller fold protein YncE
MMRDKLVCCFVVALSACTGDVIGDSEEDQAAQVASLPPTTSSYALFETLQVRPVALSPSGRRLFALNTPDNRLEVFAVGTGGKLTPLTSVVVGLEPTAVAARSDDEVWVVNHLSDSVSVVRIDAQIAATVTRTLLVGDEPRDIVFAGTNRDRAFITCAHRGQNTGDAYDLQTAGVGRADVWVFDANNPGGGAGGNRLTKLTFFADTPRALAVSGDGKTVYAAAFASGNMTTVVSVYAVETMYPNGMPGPATVSVDGQSFVQPHTGLVVKYQNGHWVDAYGTVFDPFVKIKLPDLDVFAIDATANPPTASATGAFAHVGTTLFNMAVNPRSGKVYVTNTEARNQVRFEGHTPGFTTVRGHITDSRITVIDPASRTVTPRNLNTHINYDAEGSPEEKALSVAFPQDLVVSSDGGTVYTVAQGSSKLAIYRTADLEGGTITPRLSDQVTLSGGGPTGVALDEVRNRAYVLTRFDNSIKIVDLGTRTEIGKAAMFNPEPSHIVAGRKFLYDANLTSQHGDTACASCHIGGDKDELAWDLGNPGGAPLVITRLGEVFTIPPAVIEQLLPAFRGVFDLNHPLKGPMTTQSLRGMDNHGAMHWRGDRNGAINQDGTPVVDPATGEPVVSAQPNAGIYDEVRAFTSFNVAFPGLIGRASQLSDSEMLEFARFILDVQYPPNPVRNLDNSLTAEQKRGRDFYFASTTLPDGTVRELPSDRFFNCNGCHTLDPAGNAGSTTHPGFFGSDGKISFEGEKQVFKVPHLRNMYTKVGMFGSSPDTLQPGTILLQQGPATDQIRGFGFQHDGVLGTLEHFFTGQVFLKSTTNVTLADGTVVPPNPFGIPFVDPNELRAGRVVFVDDGGFALRKAIVAFMLAFDSNQAPIVGQQITMNASNADVVAARIDLLEQRANAGECDLVVTTTSVFGANAGFLYSNGAFQPASTALAALSDGALRNLVRSRIVSALTFTCAPVGSGARLAIDRDGDGFADFDELRAGKSPTDATRHP